jgi:hypothetical protein
MKNLSAILLVLALAAGACSLPFNRQAPAPIPPTNSANSPPADSIGTVSRERSDVTRTSSGAEPALVEASDPLFSGDDVSINNGGIGLLDFGDNLRLRLFNDSDLNVVAATEQGIPLVASLFLTKGGFTGELAESGSSVVFNTPNNAEITVTGTEFFVVYDTEQQRATAGKWDGSMQVTYGGETVAINDNSYVDLQNGQPPTQQFPNPLGFSQFQEMITQINDPIVAADRIRPVATQPPQTSSSAQALGPILLGQTLLGQIAAEGGANEYTINLSTQDNLLVRLYSPNDIQPAFEILDSSGNPLCRGGNGETVVNFGCSALSPGTYSLRVSDADANESGAYSLFIQGLTNPADSVRLPFGDTYAATLTHPGMVNTYEFPGSPGDLVLVRMATPSQEFQPGYWLYKETTPQECTGNTWYDLADYTCSLTEKGIYHLFAYDPFGGSTGSYQINLLNLNDRNSLTLLLPYQRQRGEIAYPAAANAYTISGNEGDAPTIRVLLAGGDPGLSVRLFRLDGKVICEGVMVEKELSLPCRLDYAGEFRLVVSYPSGTHTGSYILWLETPIE